MSFLSRPEVASDVISGMFVAPVVLDKRVKFHDSSLNRSQKISLEAVGGGIFDRFPARYNFRREVDNDVISGMAVDNVDVAIVTMSVLSLSSTT